MRLLPERGADYIASVPPVPYHNPDILELLRKVFVRPPCVPSCAVLLLLAACATATPPAQHTVQNIAGLEAAAARDRDNVGVRVQLGAAYTGAGRHQDAIGQLEPVVARAGHPGEVWYFLGLAYEGLDRTADARRVYLAYLQGNPSSAMERTVRRRLAALDRRELERAVSAALAQERALANTAPAPRVVGVFPFLNGTGASLSPLSRALAELLTVDLSQTDRLTVVERAQVQHLLEEIQLGQSGSVDPATAARAGRLLGAGRIVQGRIDGGEAELRLQAMVVAVPGAQAQPSPITQQGTLANLLSMQNSMALALYAALGVQLTVAERERVLRQPTQNVQALLAFGLGLEAEDAGRHAEAAGHYRRAASLDPSFAEATDALDRAEARAAAAGDTPALLVFEGLRALGPAAAVEPGTAIANSAASSAQSVSLRDRFVGLDALVPSFGRRDPVSELLGSDSFERRALLQLLILRPR
jgi:tetratricopeptide (TPR) repeat protein